MRNIFVIIFLSIAIGSCKDNCKPYCQPELLWRVSFGSEVLVSSRMTPVVWQNLVVFDHMHGFTSGENKFMAFDKFTGELVWEWKDFINPNEGTGFGKGHLYQDSWIITSGRNTYSISLVDGTTNWVSHTDGGGTSRIWGFEDKFFHAEYRGDTEVLMMHDAGTGQKEEVFEVSLDGFDMNIDHMDIQRQSDGNIIIVGIIGGYNFDEASGFRELFTYSIDDSDFVLRHEPQNYLPSFDIKILNDSLVLMGGVQCRNYKNGSKVWGYGNVRGSNALYEENVLFGMEADLDKSTFKLDLNNGDKIWDTPDTGSNRSTMNLHEGILYFTGSGRLHALDAETGERIWDAESPDFKNDGDLFFDNVLTQDPETGYLYTNNYGYVLCYKPAEPR